MTEYKWVTIGFEPTARKGRIRGKVGVETKHFLLQGWLLQQRWSRPSEDAPWNEGSPEHTRVVPAVFQSSIGQLISLYDLPEFTFEAIAFE
ncbi:hypothetical protein ABZS66_36330 [Dactylosporangium sp. NPDC005572]|uniref:hypothetical protein n=1 Tax=Dactylosporangium sp. NPDC005572 TaxID=3156889 RepID=UPI0033A95833